MQSTLSVLCLLVSVGAALGWYRRPDNPVYGGWAPNRRSHLNMCIEESGKCKKSYQCCDGNVCYLEDPSQVFGRCQSSVKLYGQFTEFGWKKTNQECETSAECADQCCRRIRIGRTTRYKQKCGKPGDYVCVGSTSNDVFG